ncbi:MAG: MmcQ/YjbR family DNA-binding protein [Rhodobacteraceae bacterium]|nr:MmcQ/YjbR family DNA-binding protein [Paracoccaceae bacterium]
MDVTPGQLRKMFDALPGVVEGPCYGTPGFRVKGKLIARLWEDNKTLVVRIDPTERDVLIDVEPAVYFLTDHYRGHPWILINLKKIKAADLKRRLETAWRARAPKPLISKRDR